MNLLRTLPLLLLLAACSGDSYGPPLLTPCESKTITLTVVLHPDFASVNRVYKKLHPDKPAVEGFAGYLANDPSHHVLHVVPPRGRYDDDRFYLLGHELGHALCGSWHPEGARR